MLRTNKILMLAIAIVLLQSCLPEDDLITLPPPGDEEVLAVAQGPEYNNQIFLDLITKNQVVNDYRSWDLAFDSDESGMLVWLNSGKLMQVHNTHVSNINAVGSTQLSAAEWKFDSPDWHPDSNAIGKWQDTSGISLNEIYIVDRGVFASGADKYWKLQIVQSNHLAYQIKIERLDGYGFNSFEIPKLQNRNYNYFSFDDGGKVLDAEPDQESWDIVFTRFGHVYYDFIPPFPYLVTGVLLNPNKVEAYKDSLMDFNDIDINIAQQLNYSDARNTIGFNWKYYDFSSERYIVKPHYNFVIKDTEGYYFKLKFIDFYNEQGDKGYPKFIFKRL